MRESHKLILPMSKIWPINRHWLICIAKIILRLLTQRNSNRVFAFPRSKLIVQRSKLVRSKQLLWLNSNIIKLWVLVLDCRHLASNSMAKISVPARNLIRLAIPGIAKVLALHRLKLELVRIFLAILLKLRVFIRERATTLQIRL